MKCTSNFVSPEILRRLLPVALFSMAIGFLCGCSNASYRLPYDVKSSVSAYSFDSYDTDSIASPFAADLCVAASDITNEQADLTQTTAAGLFDITNHNTIYAKNVNKSMNPASLTKAMTAYLALKYGHLEDVLVASDNVVITESGAQVCGFKPGDKVTLDQALHGLLLYSGNDAGVLIAEYIAGSVEEFSKLMNKEAKELGATNSNFVNPHGLTDESHYTTAYDLYLIFQAAMQYDKFREIIHTTEYSTTYFDKDGKEKKLSFSTTNGYLNGDFKTPDNVNVVGGKTGTTSAAGNCLILLANNSSGESFISVVLQTDDRDILYNQMTNLLNLIP